MRRGSGRHCAGPVVRPKRICATAAKPLRCTNPLAPKAAAFSGQSQTRHLSLHGRRAEPSGFVRLQAGTGKMQRQAASGGTGERISRCVHQSQFHVARTEIQVREVRQIRRGTFRIAAAPRRRSSDDIAIVKSMNTDAFNHAPGADFHEHRLAAIRPAEHRRMGDLRTWQRIAAICPAFVVFSSGTKGTSGGASNWGCGFLPSVYQGVLFRSRAIRSCICRIRKASTREMQRDSLDTIKKLNQKHLDVDRRSGDRHAHQLFRDGVSHANQRAGVDGHLQGTEETCSKCMAREPGKSSFANNCLLARRLGRTRRPLRATFP